MPTILKQPRWSFWKFREVYQCNVRGEPARVQELAAEFFQLAPVTDFTLTPSGFEFRRSRGWRGLFSFSELKLRHQLAARFEPGEDFVRITLEYRVVYPLPLPNVHFRPSHFEKEVAALETWLDDRLNGRFPSVTPPATQTKPARVRAPLHFAFWFLYRGYRIISGSIYWTKRRFTRLGQGLLGAAIVALFSGLDVENAVGYQAFALLLALLLIATGLSFRFRAAFAVERSLPRLATAGQPFSYQVRVRNLTRETQAGLSLIEDLADPRPTLREWQEFKLDEDKHVRPFRFNQRRLGNPFKLATVREVVLPDLPPQQEAEVSFEMLPLRRGVVRLVGATFARPDPLGIYRALVKQPLPQTVLVLPKRYPLPAIALPGSMKYQQGGVALASHIGQSEEFVALREYRQGDPPRHIHWRTWAKVGKPIVKEFEDEFFVRHALVLDTFTARPHSEAFEEAVSVAASFACTVLTQESLLDLLFVGAQAYCFTAGRGLAHADQMLEILAAVRPCTTQSFTELEQLVLNHGKTVSGCICVLLEWDAPRQRFVQKLQALSLPVLVFVIRPPGQLPPLDPGPMRDTPDRFHALEIGKVAEQLARLT